MWPTEPAKADWSFNKWQKTRIPKELRQNSRRQRNVHGWAEAPVVEAVPAAAVDAAAVDVVAQAAVAPGGAAAQADKAAVADKAVVARVAKVVSVVAEAVRARAAIATVGAETVAASSSRT